MEEDDRQTVLKYSFNPPERLLCPSPTYFQQFSNLLLSLVLGLLRRLAGKFRSQPTMATGSELVRTCRLDREPPPAQLQIPSLDGEREERKMQCTNHRWATRAAVALLGIGMTLSPSWAAAQDGTARQTPVTISTMLSAAQAPGVPRLVCFNGILSVPSGNIPAGNVTLRISFYAEQQGGQALWSEMQTVRADSQGHYTVLLGASEQDGLPSDLFSADQARWVGIEPMRRHFAKPARNQDPDVAGKRFSNAYHLSLQPRWRWCRGQ